MKYIKEFYGEEYLNKQKRLLSKMTNPGGVSYFLVGEDESARIEQNEFDKYLDLAFRHNIIDKNLRSRLSSGNWEIFYQARQELMCAYFIEKIFKYKITFYPKGLGGSVGEFLIEYSTNRTIFTEVKSPIRKPSSNVWFGNDSKVIKSNLKTARKKMKLKCKNLIILAADLRTSISHEASISIPLYQEPIISFLVSPEGPLTEPKISFKRSGFFQPNANTRVSSIATLEACVVSPRLDAYTIYVLTNKQAPIDEDLPMFSFKYIFRVYHNPYAKNPIDREVFKGWPQFVLNKETDKMEWIDKNKRG